MYRLIKGNIVHLSSNIVVSSCAYPCAVKPHISTKTMHKKNMHLSNPWLRDMYIIFFFSFFVKCIFYLFIILLQILLWCNIDSYAISLNQYFQTANQYFMCWFAFFLFFSKNFWKSLQKTRGCRCLWLVKGKNRTFHTTE